MSENPFTKFNSWFLEAQKCSDIVDATAMNLATSDLAGRPSSRMVLLKNFTENGFVFYTNLESRKGGDLQKNQQAALCFYWAPLARQVRIEGTVAPVSIEEADAYFASRPRQSQIGAWASSQSQPIDENFDLTKAIAKYTLKFGTGEIPRPPHWSGFCLRPDRMEFWSEGAFRIHDRQLYKRESENQWSIAKLYP